MPAAATRKPPPKQTAETIIALRGPTRSSHLPNTAAETPSIANAILKIQTVVVSGQSSGRDFVTPSSRDIGRLKTLSAYPCPIARWIDRAAGGTSHRL